MPLQDLTPQLRTRLRRVEKIVGLFVALATLLLVAGFAYYLYHTAKRKGWFVVKVPYYTMVFSAEGLAEGDPVVMMGFDVGELTKIESMPPGSYYPVYVAFDIRQPYYGYIWTDSKLKIAAAGFLGKRQLQIIPGQAGRPTVMEKNNRITGVLVKNEYQALSATKGLFLEPLEEPALTERAEKLVAQVESALPNILILTNQLAVIMSNTADLTAHIDQLAQEARPLVGDARLVATNLQAQLAETFANLNRSLLSVADITSNLNAQVKSNDRILSEISELVTETDDLMQGLKRHWLLKSAFRPVTSEPSLQILAPSLAPGPIELETPTPSAPHPSADTP